MDFDRISEVITPFPELESPSFIHGMLAGLMCAGENIQEATWIKQLIEEAQIKSVKESFLKVLHELFLETDAGLNGSGFELELCLPDDSEKLSFRATMLGSWAEGFLYGVGLIGKTSKKMERDVTEFFIDMGDISGIIIDDLTESKESDEADFMEIVEFVRMGVLMANEFLNPSQAAPLSSSLMNAKCPTDTLQ